jgi:hypothetical protein
MPKTNFIGNTKTDIELDQISQTIRVTIVKAETERNVSRAQTIRMSGMSPANFYKAWKDPTLFRIGQLIRIYEFLKVPEPERRFA